MAKSHGLARLFVVDAGPGHVVRVCVACEAIDKVVRHSNKFTESHQTNSVYCLHNTYKHKLAALRAIFDLAPNI